MISLHVFPFNDFQVNTYLLFDETNECIILDAACNSNFENNQLSDFISKNKLIVKAQYNTHCHVDHILGNHFVKEQYGVKLGIHKEGIIFLETAFTYASMVGFQLEKIAEPDLFLNDGDTIYFGQSELKVIYTPGHAAGSVCFYNEKQKFIITGDVLFQGSIGRTDLPTGDFQLLVNNIKTRLLTLDDLTKVYPGHGPSTTIGFEKKHNQFL